MLVEGGLALLLAAGAVQPRAALDWLTGPGSWFALVYQTIGLIWLIGLLVLAVSVTTGWHRRRSILGTIVLAIVYGLPFALLIR